MTLFRELTKASLEADLNKNEAKVFSALMHQTLGFSKEADNLTDKRLASLTGVRMDRLRLAIEGVIAKGLFEVAPSKHYDYRYTIAEKFIDHRVVFFAPHILKKGTDFSKKETLSEKKNVLPKNGDIHSITFTSFNPTYSNPQQQGSAEVVSEKPIEKMIENSAPKKEEVVVVDLADFPDLPKNIEAQHHDACSRALMGLSAEQRQRVLLTLDIKQKTEVIYNSVGLLIALAKAEREGRLIVPKQKKTLAEHRPASHHMFDSPQHPDNKNSKKNALTDHIGKLNWLREHAEGESLTVFAKQMKMETYVADSAFVQRWLASRAQFEGKTVQALAEVLGLVSIFVQPSNANDQ